MAGRILRIICVGKIKTSWWREACAHYAGLIGRWRQLEIVETRDGEGQPEERMVQEGCRLLARLDKGDWPIALHGEGKVLDSPGFARLLRAADTDGWRLCFIIGGPFGLSGEALDAARMRLSLSAMTWPHELARVMLLEQIYRGESILRGMPYHH